MHIMCDKETGFGFSIRGNTDGWKVKKILNTSRCKHLKVNDVLHEINGINVKELSGKEIRKVIKECPTDRETKVIVQRG